MIADDVLLLYRRNHQMQRFPGLKPAIYTKMKTLGHIPLEVPPDCGHQAPYSLDPPQTAPPSAAVAPLIA